MSREVLGRGPPRGSLASAWLSTGHSSVTKWVEHRAEPGVVAVREAGEAVTAFLGVWEMNKCPDTDLECAGGCSGSSEACWMFSLKGTGREQGGWL